jgi:hypothetical protein
MGFLLKLPLYSLLGLAALAWVSSASAHVAFEAPSAGSVLEAGSSVELSWRVVIRHNTGSYDLELWETPGSEPSPVASDLSVDTLSYQWTVPDAPCEECSLRVVQRNLTDADYDAFLPIVISSATPEPGTDAELGEGGMSALGVGTRARGGGGCALGRAPEAPGAWGVLALLCGASIRRRPRRA